MRISLDQVEALVWIARLGSFRAAAHQLNVSQPAISGRIRELERQLGGSLFHRDDYRPRLTDLGTQTVRHAEQILTLARSLEDHADPAKTIRGPIRMGFADSFALTHLPGLLPKVEKIYPSAEFEIVIDFSANLDKKLQAGQLDFAVLTEPELNPDIAVEPLEDLELAWVAGRSLDLPSKALTPSDLKGYPIITNPRPSKLYATINEWFASVGDLPQRLYTCNSLSIMANLAAKGFGISLLPTQLFRSEVKRGHLRILNVKPALPKHHLAIAYRIDPGRPNLKPIRDVCHTLVAAAAKRK
ncbi:MAG: LysR family transcriptional regulator [Alphaproteobacteria bacterium]|nr:LysR family transcriptional regulator [Alphaproteobacteria bacterium]